MLMIQNCKNFQLLQISLGWINWWSTLLNIVVKCLQRNVISYEKNIVNIVMVITDFNQIDYPVMTSWVKDKEGVIIDRKGQNIAYT